MSLVATGQTLEGWGRIPAPGREQLSSDLETLTRNAENIPISTRDHEAIVNAVAKGDEKLAERLLHEHVIESRERLHRALAKPARAA